MLSGEVRRNLKDIFGRDRFLDSRIDVIAYGSDGTRKWYPPDAVVRPITTEEVVAVMKMADEHGFPVVPRGAASNLTGGALPLQGGVVVDFSLMNRIISIDVENLTAVVESGVVVSHLQEEAERHSLFYPPDPASNEFSTIGGNIAEGAGGLRGLKYGVTRDYVLALELVLMGGSVIRTGAATMKSVAGYDLTRLIVGSEGTLGVVTKATLKLIPLPPAVGTAQVIFSCNRSALKAASLIVASRLFPRALEFVDSNCLKIIRECGGALDTSDQDALLLVEFDGTKETVESELSKLESILEGLCRKFERTTDSAKRGSLWKMRKSISPSVYRITPIKVSEDICVPRSQLGAILDEIEKIGRRHSIRVLSYGHAGDGNLHVNFIPPDTSESAMSRVYQAVEDLFKATVASGGTISGEHGIGVTKQEYLHLEVRERELGLMKAIKSCFDPKGLLNPGKVFTR
ncbi:MAG: FAD-linked oxidase C-terminal domain-containing protein [Planctomycetota bacterium]